MKRIFFVIALVLAASKSEASCWFFCEEPKTEKPIDQNPQQTLDVKVTESAEEAEQIRLELEALQRQAIEKFSEIETNLKDGQNGIALKKAKFVLDSIRTKTGIDPKVKIQQSFFVPAIFPEDAGRMDHLNEVTRNLVIRTISDFRGGLYMDLMTLAKRTRLLYIRALKAEIKKDGGLNLEDRKKIIKDIVDATVVPMPVEDKHGHKIFVYDNEIANEDHTYLFNRELKMFLIQDPDLKLTEEEFVETVGLKLGLPSKVHPFDICIVQASQQHYDWERQARWDCFADHFNNAGNFTVCRKWANLQKYDLQGSALRYCFDRYGQRK